LQDKGTKTYVRSYRPFFRDSKSAIIYGFSLPVQGDSDLASISEVDHNGDTMTQSFTGDDTLLRFLTTAIPDESQVSGTLVVGFPLDGEQPVNNTDIAIELRDRNGKTSIARFADEGPSL